MVRIHVLMCPAYAQLFRTHPERCLDPDAEYVRYKTEDDTSEARAKIRDVKLQQRFAEMDRLQSIQAKRWQKPKDILED